MYDWNHVGLLLHVVEKLQGHPNLKHIQAAAMKELAELKPLWGQNEKPSITTEPKSEPEVIEPPPPNQPEDNPGPEGEIKRRSIGD